MTKRATNPEAKDERRRHILDAAEARFERANYTSVTMASVARDAGLGKGTLYLYFPTKEALFLEALSSRLTNWFTQLESEVEHSTGTPADVADRFAATLAQRPKLCRLLTMLHSTLEVSPDAEHVEVFRGALDKSMAPLAQTIERRMPALSGHGERMLLHVMALAIGLFPMGATGHAAEKQPLRVDFASELRYALTRWIAGHSGAHAA